LTIPSKQMKKMKKILALVLALIMVMSLVACGGGSKKDDGAKVIKIAVAAPMTGDNAEYGIGFANAAKLMAQKWNDNGGVDVGGEKYTVEIVEFDDKSDSDEAALIAEKIVSDDSIQAVLGHFASGSGRGRDRDDGQALCREGAQSALEFPECAAGFKEVARFYHAVIRGGIVDKFVGAPIIAGFIHKQGISVQRGNQFQNTAGGVFPIAKKIAVQMRGHQLNVFHHFFRLFENEPVDMLQGILNGMIAVFVRQMIGTVDIAAGQFFYGDKASVEMEAGQNMLDSIVNHNSLLVIQ